MSQKISHTYDVVIIGAGASGSALAYILARYFRGLSIAIFEKYEKPGQVNSKATNNSQTLHVGDIETNYPIEKAAQVKVASMMLVQYAKQLPADEQSKILFVIPKMVLGVGSKEVSLLKERYRKLSEIFPDLLQLDARSIASVEPKVMEGRNPDQPVAALYDPKGYAVDFENLSESFIDQALIHNPNTRVSFNSKVQKAEKDATNNCYRVYIENGEVVSSKVVVVDADSYSLLFAKQLGYGKQYSLIPIAGNFYFSETLLSSKVYTVQEPKLPFAAVHGDPDVRKPGVTRWGPTARFHPVLESRNLKTFWGFLRSSGLGRLRTWISFVKILFDPVRLKYLLKNMLYEIPFVGKRMFLSNIRKIVPTIKAKDVRLAKGYGGMRLQRVNTIEHTLELGEGKIVGDNIIFNMTPSPGASVALYNAMRDAEQVAKFLGSQYYFNKVAMEEDLVDSQMVDSSKEVSLTEGYAS